MRQEVYKIINFWLDHGLSGFRVDAIVNIKKKLPFKDYAPDRPDGLCDLTVMKKEVEGIGEFLGEMSDLIFKKEIFLFLERLVMNGKALCLTTLEKMDIFLLCLTLLLTYSARVKRVGLTICL